MADVTLVTTSTLNGGSIDIKVYEDTDGDGTANNTTTVSLTGGSNETNLITSFDGSSGNDYWIDFKPSVTAATDDAPTLSKASLMEGDQTTGGGGDGGGGGGAGDSTVMDDFNDGDLAEWDRTDPSWATSTTHNYEGTHGVHSNNTSGTQHTIVASEGSLDADFGPGDVYHFVYKEVGSSEATQVYFGKQDTSKADNTYIIDLRVFAGQGGIQIDKTVSGTRSSVSENVTGIPKIPNGGSWGHIYLMWDTGDISGDPHNATAGTDGDLYLEIQDDSAVPKFSAYFDVGDQEFRGGGVGFSHNDGNDLAYDLLEKAASADGFADFNPSRHFTGSGEIHFFRTGDISRVTSGNPENAEVDMVGSSVVSAARNSFCLRTGAGMGFQDDEGHSAPGAQSEDLPAYLPDGQKGRCFVRTPTVSGEIYVGCASDGGSSGDDYLRAEIDYSNDRFRLMEWVNGSNTVVATVDTVGWAADTWYEIEFDRTTSGDVTATATDDGTGTQMASATHTLDTSLVGNDGVLLFGGANGGDGPEYYFDHWENLS